MQKNDSQSIHVIDNSIREQMSLFDRFGGQLFQRHHIVDNEF